MQNLAFLNIEDSKMLDRYVNDFEKFIFILTFPLRLKPNIDR